MNRILIAAVSLLTLSGVGVAHAESNELAAVERPATTGEILSSPSAIATGSDSYPDFAEAQSMPVVSGGVIALTGSEGPVQSPSSLPVGFLNGTSVYDYALSVQRAFAAQADHKRLTGVARAQHPG